MQSRYLQVRENSGMKHLMAFGLVVTLMSGGMKMCSAADLKSGDDAPPFELTGRDGKTYRLSDFKDSKAVVIAWYPKAFTGG